MRSTMADEKYTSIAGELSLSSRALVELIRAVFEKGKPFRFRASGSSMKPTIKDGDIVTSASSTGRTLDLGDIVLFLRSGPGNPVVHRVVGRKKEGYLLKGDNSMYNDGLIAREQIIGIIKKVERDGKIMTRGLHRSRYLAAFLSRINLLQPIARLAGGIISVFRRSEN